MHAPEEGPLWYALYVRTRFERVVAQSLRAKRYEEFLPLYRRSSQRSDRLKENELPLFPGYVFCRFNASDRLPILTIPGVNAIVGFGQDFIPVDEGELNAIRGVVGTNTHCEPWPFLQVGQRVRVENGALTGTEGFVLRFKNSYRLVISINLLQRSVALEIDRDCFKPLTQNGIKWDAKQKTALPSPPGSHKMFNDGFRR